MEQLKKYDDRKSKPNAWNFIRTIKKKIRECEKYHIDYDSYLDHDDFRYIIEVLDCCLDDKDSKYIIRTD